MIGLNLFPSRDSVKPSNYFILFENISLQLIYSIPTWITIVNKVNHSSLFSALIGILNKSNSLFFSLHIKRKPVVVALISLSLLKIASSIQSNYIFS